MIFYYSNRFKIAISLENMKEIRKKNCFGDITMVEPREIRTSEYVELEHLELHRIRVDDIPFSEDWKYYDDKNTDKKIIGSYASVRYWEFNECKVVKF